MTGNRVGWKAAILMMSFLQMATNAAASILAELAAAFPEASTSAVQYLMTFPNLLVVVMSIATAKLSEYIAKKYLAAAGLALGVVSGLCAFLFHRNLVLLYVWAALLGIGIGIVIPVATSLISDFFEGQERETMLGLQTAAANAGSMCMTFTGGLLAAYGWHYNYLVYLFAVPGLILTLLFIPGKRDMAGEQIKVQAADQSRAIPGRVVGCMVVAMGFMLLFYIAPTNLAMYVSQRQMGDSFLAGTAATVLLLGGTVAGVFFGRLSERIGEWTIALGFAVLAAGYLILCAGVGTAGLMAAGFLIGTSNALVLPQCMGKAAAGDRRRSTFYTSLVFATANLGTFLAPSVTMAARLLTGGDTVVARFMTAAVISLAAAVISGVILCRRKRRAG